MYIYVYICIYKYIYMYVCTYVCMHIYVHKTVYMRVCAHLCMRVWTRLYVCPLLALLYFWTINICELKIWNWIEFKNVVRRRVDNTICGILPERITICGDQSAKKLVTIGTDKPSRLFDAKLLHKPMFTRCHLHLVDRRQWHLNRNAHISVKMYLKRWSSCCLLLCSIEWGKQPIFHPGQETVCFMVTSKHNTSKRSLCVCYPIIREGFTTMYSGTFFSIIHQNLNKFHHPWRPFIQKLISPSKHNVYGIQIVNWCKVLATLPDTVARFRLDSIKTW